MKAYKTIIDVIGNTPLVELPVKETKWKLFLKLEKFNPGQSMKDRMALNMINQAEKEGILKPGGTIIESSSGNTAIGLAMVAAIRGYKFIAVVDHHAAKEKINIIRAYGGQILYARGNYRKDEVAVAERERIARKLSLKTPNSFFPEQAHNLNNRASYPDTLARELFLDLGSVDALIGSIGTGGSLSGTAQGVKKYNPKAKVIAIEPKGSIIFGGPGGPYFQSGTGNPPDADIPRNVDFSIIDENDYASDQEAFNTCRYLARKRGILVGGSSGGVIYKAVQKVSTYQGIGMMVAIVPDGGERYISTIFNDGWIRKNKLVDSSIERYLDQVLS